MARMPATVVKDSGACSECRQDDFSRAIWYRGRTICLRCFARLKVSAADRARRSLPPVGRRLGQTSSDGQSGAIANAPPSENATTPAGQRCHSVAKDDKNAGCVDL
jgi:hypothetical protein